MEKKIITSKDTTITKESLYCLLEHNTQKMHFHSEGSFKYQNWALLVTLGCLTFVWKDILSSKIWIIDILTHLFSISALIYLNKKNKEWDTYYYRFVSRVIYIENIIKGIEEVPITDQFIGKYHSNIYDKKKDKTKLKKFYFICMSLVIVSLILKVLFDTGFETNIISYFVNI